MNVCVRRGGMILIAALVFTNPNRAQEPKEPKKLEWTHAFDLAARKFGEVDFTPTTQRFGVEALRDFNLGRGLYVTEKGSIALAPGFEAVRPANISKGPAWITGLDLPARKAGEKEFTKTTKIYALEVFRDPNTEDYLYITEHGALAAAQAAGKVRSTDKAPQWVHSVDLNVRKGGVKDWKDAGKVGIEVYRDPNTGNLVYISDMGSIAVIAEGDETKATDKAPSWLHGLDLSVRKANEPTFTKETRKYGVEVFRDEATDNLIYVCESGAIAVAPGGAKLAAPTATVKEPTWSHGWNVKVRKPGEKEFTDRTQIFGGEAFRDENTGVLIAVSETGAISALPAKQ
jgi:hypothetical protein